MLGELESIFSNNKIVPIYQSSEALSVKKNYNNGKN